MIPGFPHNIRMSGIIKFGFKPTKVSLCSSYFICALVLLCNITNNYIGNWRGSSNKCIKKQINLFRSTYCSRLYGNWRGSSNECIKKQIIVKGADWIALVGLLVPITLLVKSSLPPFIFGKLTTESELAPPFICELLRWTFEKLGENAKNASILRQSRKWNGRYLVLQNSKW